MPQLTLPTTLFLAVALFSLPLAAQSTNPTHVPQYPALPSELPASVKLPEHFANYTRRTVMIAMRDGVKLNTIILIPDGAKHAPMLMTRTPYSAAILTANAQSSHLDASLYGMTMPLT